MSLSNVTSDLRLALRQMRRRPLFYGLLLAVLATGVGATTGTFSMLQAFVVRPLPYPHPEDLVALWRSPRAGQRLLVSQPQFMDWKARVTTLSHLATASSTAFTVIGGDHGAEMLPGATVSGEFFPLFGLVPRLGRLLVPSDDRENGPLVVVIGELLWRVRFAADPAVVGRSLLIDGRPHVVVGVAPEGFAFAAPTLSPVHLWMPIATSRIFAWLRSAPQEHTLHLLGRRLPGVSLPAIESELYDMAASSPPGAPRPGIMAMGLQRAALGDLRGALLASFAAVALVFLMVCSNVGSLLLMRAFARRGDFALRSALGASRPRLVQQTLSETLLLFSMAAPPSLLVARFVIFALGNRRVDWWHAEFRWIDVRLDVGALAFCLGFSLICGVSCGLLPALWASRPQLLLELSSSGAHASAPRTLTRLRGMLVVSQIAIAFTLLMGGGLSRLSLGRLLATPLGFDADGLVGVRFFNLDEHYADRAARRALFERALVELGRAPGVLSVGANDALPFSENDGWAAFEVAGHSSMDLPSAPRNVVTPTYFGAMQIPVLLGRGVEATDTVSSAPIALINQELMDRHFPGTSPIGQYIRHPDHDGGRLRRIVGVVANTRRSGPAAPPVVETFVPYSQAQPGGLALVLRTEDPEGLIAALPTRIAALDPSLQSWCFSVADEARLMTRDLEQVAAFLQALAGIALLVASINLYALLAYVTAQRTRELGIRLALGAAPSGLVWLVARSSLKWLASGALLGIGLALALGRELASHFPGLAPFNPAICVTTIAVIVISGLIASVLAALPALAMTPATALRYE